MRLTTLPAASTIATDDQIIVNDKSDTSESPAGTTKRATVAQVATAMAGAAGGLAGVTNPEKHGATGNGVANDTASLSEIRDDHNAASTDDVAAELAARTYLSTGVDQWPMGLSLVGRGPASVIKTTTNAGTLIQRDTDAPERAKASLFAFFHMLGDGKATGKTDQTGIEIGRFGADGAARVRLIGITAKDLGGTAFAPAYGDDIALGPVGIGLLADSCKRGLTGWVGTQIGFQALACTEGVVVASGNFDLIGGTLKGCDKALEVLAGGNDAHGLVVGVAFLHNTIAIKLGATANGHYFTAIRLFEGNLDIANGNAKFHTFNASHIDGTNYDLKGKTRWLNCTFGEAYYASHDLTDGENEFRGCRGETGTIPAWIGQANHPDISFPSDADVSLTSQQSWAEVIEITPGAETGEVNLFNTRTPSRGEQQRLINRTAETVNYFWGAGDGIAIPPLKTADVGFEYDDGETMVCYALSDNVASSVVRPGSFDPASLDYKLWCRGSYGGIPWAGVPSAGTSGAHTLTNGGAAPGVGAAIDGFTPATFNGTTEEARATAPDLASDFITTAAYFVELVIKPTNQPASTGFPYTQPGILTEGGGNWAVYRELNTIRVYHASTEVASATVPEDLYSHVAIRYGLVAGELDIFVDGVLADHNTGVAATGAVGGILWLGTNYGATVNFEGDIMEVKAAYITPSDVDIANLYAAAQDRYPSMGL